MKSNSLASTFLGSTSQNQDPIYTDVVSNAFLEVTLNAPRVKGFVNLTSRQQQSLLLKVFRTATTKLNCESELKYEFGKDGTVHAHGWIRLKDKGHITGLIMDIAKYFHRCFKQPVSVNHYCSEWMRFRSPSCCIQYRWMKSDEDSWLKYINKQQEEDSRFASWAMKTPSAVDKEEAIKHYLDCQSYNKSDDYDKSEYYKAVHDGQ